MFDVKKNSEAWAVRDKTNAEKGVWIVLFIELEGEVQGMFVLLIRNNTFHPTKEEIYSVGPFLD
jgi:hypothetical protein